PWELRRPRSVCSPVLLPYRSHLLEVFVHVSGERGYFIGKSRQRRRVTFGQLLDAPSERLRHAVKFALNGAGQRAQPFVVYEKGFDFILGELRVPRECSSL